MQTFRSQARNVARSCIARPYTRTLFVNKHHYTTQSIGTSSQTPWFVDPEPLPVRHAPPHLAPNPQDLPENIPAHVKQLYVHLHQSPYLDPSSLIVREHTAMPPGPPLPKTIPKGKRQRGRTYSGEGLTEEPGGIWSWVFLAQVKEGTENRGSIESVIRLVRKTLLTMQPPLPLPPNSKRRMHNGWAMIDAGDFAVHIVSREAREKYFERPTDW
ncbi:hypothetical protein SERLA73DRAFT_112966 [Serpula lacrymans var. lacrymans S7.3]|uniref:Uncharacterized protein n=1 Tax=Serpula lacrymans var. lacrymans (strain S7.3) TaxID=936435 RepID=F8Q7A5_SERL3|nr:hypothetical protein SERLA73DRAFT_112966 [Serpula lacrymans var. lacrymans S7.3]